VVLAAAMGLCWRAEQDGITWWGARADVPGLSLFTAGSPDYNVADNFLGQNSSYL
jgi:hypothetical protein